MYISKVMSGGYHVLRQVFQFFAATLHVLLAMGFPLHRWRAGGDLWWVGSCFMKETIRNPTIISYLWDNYLYIFIYIYII